MNNHSSLLDRRALLKLALVAGAASACPLRGFGAPANPPPASSRRIADYLETLARPDGGYAWGDQESSHLTPTYGVIGAYRLLGIAPPRRETLVAYVRAHHPRALKKLEQERRIFDFQQVQALAWLDADLAEFRPRIAALTQPMVYMKQYERHGYPIFQSELGVVMSHALLGLPTTGLAGAFGGYIEERRRANGSFNNTPAADGGDGHVMNTLWALQAARVLGRDVVKRDELVAWLQSCQIGGSRGVPPEADERTGRPRSQVGGFTFAPRPEFGGVDDIAYTRAALRALQLLGAAPVDRDACVAQIHSLANTDGGFGDRAGWASNATATFYALDALAAIGALDTLSAVKPRAPRPRKSLPPGLNVYSIQIESHGTGSPAEAVDLARALKIDLWGAKNGKPGWADRVRELAAAQQVPVTFFTADEEYGTWVDIPGLGTYSHTSDLVAPLGADIGPPLGTRAAPPAPVSWPEFRTRRLAPLERGGGRLVWQFGENEELVRMFLDDSVERGGFAAISTYHFGNPDFMNTEPFLNRWRGRIPFIGLQDAHGPEPWWFSDQTTGFRTLFLATAPTWDGWLQALKENWTVAVRHDVWTKGRTWMHSGSDEVLAFVREREDKWCWWDNPAIARPMVSIVPLTPSDHLEAGRPESGVKLRVRCAWENTPQGLLKAPLAELVRLSVDDREVAPVLESRKRPNGLLDEHAHHYLLPADTPPGSHAATAVVRVIETGRTISRTIAFKV
ncbi:prenyltransferase/squalene oxidase repeat-containing protein [Horticoccus sp. 23ND18S-11]|uniref:prenyltransferase/squalene oxidase repeat-containing protein n=1 Tax=Horticoccus sp. 23ND18S-11 TaxID=3391832 RepID=UPI0039C8E3B3